MSNSSVQCECKVLLLLYIFYHYFNLSDASYFLSCRHLVYVSLCEFHKTCVVEQNRNWNTRAIVYGWACTTSQTQNENSKLMLFKITFKNFLSIPMEYRGRILLPVEWLGVAFEEMTLQ